MRSKKGPLNEIVNEIDKLYSSPERRKHCWELARELHEQTANFIQKVKIVDDPKFDLSNCPWPFGLIILEERKGKKRGETKRTQLHGSDRTTRRLRIPDDIAAVHTFLALFRDEHLGIVDRIVTYEIRNICPYIGTSPLIISDTAEIVETKIPALIRCAQEDLKAKGLIPESIDNSTKPPAADADDKSIDKIRTDGNKVPWDERDPNFYRNKKAIEEANKLGNEHDIDELKNIDYDKLKKLLRKPACKIKYMSVKSPRPRGKVNKIDWREYLKNQIKQTQRIENAVDQKVLELMQ